MVSRGLEGVTVRHQKTRKGKKILHSAGIEPARADAHEDLNLTP